MSTQATIKQELIIRPAEQSMQDKASDIMDAAMEDDIWNEILSPDSDIGLNDLLRLSTDYSCHGCAF